MRIALRSAVVLLALVLPAALVMAAPSDGFSAKDPRYRQLYPLEKRATALFDSSDYAVYTSPQTRDAWVRLHAAAMRVKVGGRVHPLAGVALINLSSMAEIAGNNPETLARASEGVSLLAPFADAYPISWMQGLSIKGMAQARLGDDAGGAATLAQASDYIDRYVARTPPDKRDPQAHMLRSNIAQSHGQALLRLGRYADAVVAQKASLDARIAAAGPDSPYVIPSYYTYAQILQRAGRNVEAERYARLAVDKAIDHGDRKHPSYSRALEALGLLLSRTGRRVESLDYLQRAIAIKRETVGTDSLYFQFGLQNLGSVFLPLERYADAEPLFMEAERGFRKVEGENSRNSAQALALAATASLAEGRYAQTIERLNAALAKVRTGLADDQDIGQRVYPYLVPALIATGRTEAARAAAAAYLAVTRQVDDAAAFPLAQAAVLNAWADGNDEAALRDSARRLAGVVRDGASVNDDGELTHEQRAALDLVLAVATRTQDGALALDAMAVLAGSRIAQANRLVSQRLVADPVLAGRVRGLQDRVKALEAADRRLLKALATDDGIADARAARMGIASGVEAERAAIADAYPRWTDARGGERPTLARLQASLGRREALLAVVPAFDGVYLLAMSASGVRVERAALGRAAMVALVNRLRSSLTPGGFDQAAAQDLYGQIFTPGILATLGKARSLRIVPTGAFASLPFAMLLQRPATTTRDAAWLVQRFAIAVQPGFAIDPAEAPTMAAGKQRFLGIGAPLAFADTGPNGTTPADSSAGLLAANHYFRNGAADAHALSQLPPLPGSLAELRAVAKRFGPRHATLLTGADASEAAVRATDLSAYGVILFATHGLVNGEMEGVTEPALVLAPSGGGGAAGDGLLTASEVASLRLAADWVILSACNTAAGGDAQGAAYSGLAQAFRYAGAGSLLVSHWPVRDDASAFVTLETVKGASQGLPRAVALQRTMLKLIRSGQPGADQPYIWAPFVLMGR